MHNTVLCLMETIQHWLWVVHSAFAHRMRSLLGMWCTCFCTKGLPEISSRCNGCFSDRLSNHQCDYNRVEQQCEFREAGELWKVNKYYESNIIYQLIYVIMLIRCFDKTFPESKSLKLCMSCWRAVISDGAVPHKSVIVFAFCFLNVCHHCNIYRIYHTLTLLLSILTTV